ncbi:galactosyl transferase GMA12/MNN10 family-domain-containing protein [Lipomyces oligophaga]|uniref:galactosyl transferase GMA12/MNN10 family-domain-containing protein n=1 Tax=Lipomyces oligophaga TaxID=45792 RepID=UPI0034CDF0E1
MLTRPKFRSGKEVLIDGFDVDETAAQTRHQRVSDLWMAANDTLEPKGDKIVLLTASDGRGHNAEIPHLMENVVSNRQEYCAYHGYTYEFVNITKYSKPNQHIVWSKLPIILDSFRRNPNAEWIWWLDVDAIIVTPQIDLASYLLSPDALKSSITYGKPLLLRNGADSDKLIPSEVDLTMVDLILTQDHNGLNCGSMIFRRSAWIESLIELWSDPKYINAKYERLEQDALLNLVLFDHPELLDHIAFVLQRKINAYSVGGRLMGWHEGDLVIHFAGCWVEHMCEKVWNDYMNRRIPLQISSERKKVDEGDFVDSTQIQDASGLVDSDLSSATPLTNDPIAAADADASLKHLDSADSANAADSGTSVSPDGSTNPANIVDHTDMIDSTVRPLSAPDETALYSNSHDENSN